MKRICPGCKEERDIEQDFRWRYKARGIRQTWCKYCQARANKVHYQNNKQAYLERALTRNARVVAENKQRLQTYLSTHACVDCGCSDIRCLEFDHINGIKSGNIAVMLRSVSWNVLEAEIEKCEVRCANCHRIKTNERGKWWRTLDK